MANPAGSSTPDAKNQSSTGKKPESKKGKEKLYCILVRVHYRSFMHDHSEYIDPAPDPFAPDAPRRSFDHLSNRDINKLLARGVIAHDKVDASGSGTAKST